MKYVVEITETLQRLVVVEAKDPEEAEREVSNMYRQGQVVLDDADHIDVAFQVTES
ncbi:MAG: DpnD/PcfM family protein [Kiritimatiellae bacterium]|nr:DpnD/PcfM family protein [Kiritimatiellia bacterium]